MRAARAGGFGLVIGVDRADHADFLRSEGADVVVDDLAEFVTNSPETHHPLGPKVHRLIAAGTRPWPPRAISPSTSTASSSAVSTRTTSRSWRRSSLANGYLGLRGAHDEGRPVYDPAPCINRFYETWPIVYPEHAYGFANTGQTAVGALDGGVIRLYVDDEPFDLDHVEILDYERAPPTWTTAPSNGGPLCRRLGVRAALPAPGVPRVPAPGLHRVRGDLARPPAHLCRSPPSLSSTPTSGRWTSPIPVAAAGCRPTCWSRRWTSACSASAPGPATWLGCGVDHDLSAGVPVDHPQTIFDEREIERLYRVEAVPKQPVRLVKYLAYHHGATTSFPELAFRVGETLDRPQCRLRQDPGQPAGPSGRLGAQRCRPSGRR